MCTGETADTRLQVYSYTVMSCACDIALKNDHNNYCTDINECDMENGDCDQVCMNTMGSFTCSCMMGYEINDDGMTCDGKQYRQYTQRILTYCRYRY